MQLVGHLPPQSVVDLSRLWPAASPVLALLGTGRFWTLATCFEEVPVAAALAERVDGMGDGGSGAEGFRTGLVLVASYDDYDVETSAGRPTSAPSRAFRVHESLVLDRDTGELWRCGAAPAGGGAAGSACIALDPAALAAAARPLEALRAELTPLAQPLALAASAPDAAYLAAAERALEDIRDGRFYQVNLLRYFAAAVPGAGDAAAFRAWAFARLLRFAGPFGAFLDVPGLSLVSFSPERFVRARGGAAETCPVKGTAARAADPAADAAAAADLLASRKDRAELHMIVDLMRNDLGRVSEPGTVAVPEPLRLDSYVNVHHLSARVTSRLRAGLTLGDLLTAVCPGGSITGAPKREAMRGIREAEGRRRGYFMGKLVCLDAASGALDSSILIRTLVGRPGAGTGAGATAYEFAAGSGIVIGSDAARERDEIAAKCAVVTAP